MKKILILVSVVFGLIVGYYAYLIMHNKHNTIMGVTRKKMELFKLEERTKLNKMLLFSEVNNADDYSHFVYNSSYYISIWEFKLSKNILGDSCKIILNQNKIFPKSNLCETFHPKGNRPVKIKYNYSFGDNMKIFVSEQSKNVKKIKSKNLIGIFGEVDEISVCSNSEELITYVSPKKLNNFMFLILSNENGFYLITIESDKYFDEKMLSVFSF